MDIWGANMEEDEEGLEEEEGGVVDVDAEDKLECIEWISGGDVGDVVWAGLMNSCCWAL